MSESRESDESPGDLGIQDVNSVSKEKSEENLSHTNSVRKIETEKMNKISEASGTSFWQWEHREGFRSYDAKANHRIEEAYQKGLSHVRLKSGKMGATPMEIFIIDMIQLDPTTGNQRKIRRIGPNTCWQKICRFINGYLRSWEEGRPRIVKLHEYSGKLTPTGFTKVLDDSTLAKTCTRVVQSSWFLPLSMLVVVLNTVYIAIQADHPTDAASSLFDHLFCIFFTLELAVRFGTFKRWRDCLHDHWFVFDGILVLLMIGETWIMPLVLLTSSEESSSGPGTKEYSVMRSVKMLRMGRLGRIVRLLRMFPEVMMLLKGVFRAMRAVLYTLLLLLILLFLFAILFKTQSEATELAGTFNSVSQSMWILLIRGALLDEPSGTLDELVVSSPFLTAVFLVFIFISNLTVLNMLIGIICNVVQQVSVIEKEQAAISDLKKALFELLDCFDKDDDRQIEVDEFELLLRNPELKLILKNFGVDSVDLMSLKDVLFEKQEVPVSQKNLEMTNATLADENPTNRSVSQSSCSASKLTFDEFIEVVVRLRGGNSATVMDVVELRELIRLRFERLEQMSKNDHVNDGLGLAHTNGHHDTSSHHEDVPSAKTLQTHEQLQEMEAKITSRQEEIEQRQEARHADLLEKISSMQMQQQRQEERLVNIVELLDRVFQRSTREVPEKSPASQAHQVRCQDLKQHLDKNTLDDCLNVPETSNDCLNDLNSAEVEEVLKHVDLPQIPPLPSNLPPPLPRP